MTTEHDELLKRLVDGRAAKINKKKIELTSELKNQDELLNAYWDGIYDAIKEIEKASLWEEKIDAEN